MRFVCFCAWNRHVCAYGLLCFVCFCAWKSHVCAFGPIGVCSVRVNCFGGYSHGSRGGFS